MPTTLEAILVIILFLLPGMVIALALERTFQTSSDLRFVLKTIYFSVAIQILWSWWTIDFLDPFLEETIFDNPFDLVVWAAIVTIVYPLVLAYVTSWIADYDIPKAALESIGLVPKRPDQAWDALFQMKSGYWVIVTLRDGRKIAGKYDQNSFVGSAPSPKDIYIEEIWDIDEHDNFTKKLERSKGAWLHEEQIVSIVFFD